MEGVLISLNYDIYMTEMPKRTPTPLDYQFTLEENEVLSGDGCQWEEEGTRRG
jgi:hypothetical protein